MLEPFPIKLGRVMDISEGGIEIRYFEEDAWPDDFSVLSIRVANDRAIRLENIPVTTVDDLKVADSPAAVTEKRRRSLRFGNLSEDQRQQLEDFIKQHTDFSIVDFHDIAV